MSAADIDWRYLARGSFVPASTLMVMLVVFGATVWAVQSYQSDYGAISSSQSAMNADYNELITRKRIVDRYYRRYEAFREQGFVGREARLDWIETMRETAEALDLPSLNYSIEPQRRVTVPTAQSSDGESAGLFVSRLDLDASLLHEEDLLRLIDALQQRAPGLMMVDRCELLRRSEPDSLLVNDPNIVADCSVNVYSMLTTDVPGESE